MYKRNVTLFNLFLLPSTNQIYNNYIFFIYFYGIGDISGLYQRK